MVLPQFAHYRFPIFEFRTGVPKGGSEGPGFGWLGNIGEPLVLHFLRPRVTSSVNPSSRVIDDMMRCLDTNCHLNHLTFFL